MAVASHLALKPEFKNKQDILLIEPSNIHYYQVRNKKREIGRYKRKRNGDSKR